MPKKVALIGNPNAGKTTLFNAMTGLSQRVGNWSGVTVEKVSSIFFCQDVKIELVDLPGVYSLTEHPHLSEDEKITIEYTLERRFHFILNVVDVNNLARHLYLTLQLLERGWPVALVLTRAKVNRPECELALSKMLGCPVISVSAQQGTNGPGISDLQLLLANQAIKPSNFQVDYGADIENIIEQTLVEEPNLDRQAIIKRLEQTEDMDVKLASTRFNYIDKLMATLSNAVIHPPKNSYLNQWSAKIDKFVLHRFFGVPFFLLAMYAMFVFAIHIGGIFQDFFDGMTKVLFVDGLAQVLYNIHAPDWLITLLAYGAGQGLNTTLAFIPVIGAMFFALAFLEDSGYMARAAFVMDRVMRAIGLPGKSFVPLIVGFGCNVPAVMGTRTLESKRDKILTVMISPFMSCGARLAIFTVFVSAFFAKDQNIIFALYLIGIAMALLTGFLLKKTLLKGSASPLVLELPDYQLPSLKLLTRHAWHRIKHFVVNAARLIVTVSMVLAILNYHPYTENEENPESHSTLLTSFGQSITPIFYPMGIEESNWQATVGLLTGVLAKEVVIGTLNSLYMLDYFEHQHNLITEKELTFSEAMEELRDAFKTIPENIQELGQAIIHPITSAAPIEEMEEDILEESFNLTTLPKATASHAVHSNFGMIHQHFGTSEAAFAYLLFVLLYFPCVSTTAAMVKEVQRGWAIFSIFWTTGMAYGVAVLFYQFATFSYHPLSSTFWVMGTLGTFIAIVLMLRHFGYQRDKKLLPTKIVLT